MRRPGAWTAVVFVCIVLKYAQCFSRTKDMHQTAQTQLSQRCNTRLAPLQLPLQRINTARSAASGVPFATSVHFTSVAACTGPTAATLLEARTPALRSTTLLNAKGSQRTQPRRSKLEVANAETVVGTWRNPQDGSSRPASEVFPKALVQMHPATQALIAASTLALHLFAIGKVVFPFPVQMIPNTLGLAQSISLETVLGISALFVGAYVRRLQQLPLIPSLQVSNATMPAQQPQILPKQKNVLWKELTAALVVFVGLFMLSGASVPLMNRVFVQCVKWGFQLSFPMQRSVHVLVSHLLWVLPGSMVLRLCKSMVSLKARQLQRQLRQTWVWWAVGGYFASCALLNIGNAISELLLPRSTFEQVTTITEMLDPQENTVASMTVGALAPCVSAPIWEEVIYRSFLLNILSRHLPIGTAIIVCNLVFSAHHVQLGGFLPLAMIGTAWTAIYLLCGNLVATIALHAMWNSRAFFASMLFQ